MNREKVLQWNTTPKEEDTENSRNNIMLRNNLYYNIKVFTNNQFEIYKKNQIRVNISVYLMIFDNFNKSAICVGIYLNGDLELTLEVEETSINRDEKDLYHPPLEDFEPAVPSAPPIEEIEPLKPIENFQFVPPSAPPIEFIKPSKPQVHPLSLESDELVKPPPPPRKTIKPEHPLSLKKYKITSPPAVPLKKETKVDELDYSIPSDYTRIPNLKLITRVIWSSKHILLTGNNIDYFKKDREIGLVWLEKNIDSSKDMFTWRIKQIGLEILDTNLKGSSSVQENFKVTSFERLYDRTKLENLENEILKFEEQIYQYEKSYKEHEMKVLVDIFFIIELYVNNFLLMESKDDYQIIIQMMAKLLVDEKNFQLSQMAMEYKVVVPKNKESKTNKNPASLLVKQIGKAILGLKKHL